MVKGRHGKTHLKKGLNKSAKSEDVVPSNINDPIFHRALSSINENDQDDFIHPNSPLLLTLLFRDKVSQHSALARIESFYESKVGVDDEKNYSSNRFLTLEQSKSQKLCPNYEAFNCPISSIIEWLEQMQLVHISSSSSIANGKITLEEGTDNNISDSIIQEVVKDDLWWESFCNEEENELLRFLNEIGCLDQMSNPVTPQYLITSVTSQAKSSLPHERLHFLYFISFDYRSFVQDQFDSLSQKTRKVIETDLNMRGYAKHVWPDEFQAYISLDSSEFGNATKSECALIKPKLQQQQRLIWKQLNAS